MNLLRPLALCAILIAVPASALPAQAALPPTVQLAPGDWSPTPDQLARATRLAGFERAAAIAYLAKLRAESPELAIETCRAGLRLRDDRAALKCAVHLPWDALDNREHERVIALSIDHYARPGTIVDFEKLRSMIGSIDMDRVLAGFPEPPWDSTPSDYLGNLHRQLRAAHIPALCRLAASTTDQRVREATIDNLIVLLPRTNRYRPLVAKTFLGGLKASDPLELRPATNRPGLHPLLVKLLRKNWLSDDSTSRAWELRWLHDAVPAARDAKLLAEIANAERWTGSSEQLAAVRAMRHLQDSESLAVLRAFAADADAPDDLGYIAQSALIQRGATTKSWTKLAAAAAAGDVTALGLWFELQPRASVRMFTDRVLGGDANAAHAALDDFESAVETRSELHLDWAPTLFEGFADAAMRSKVDGLVLGRIGTIIPGCNTTALAEAACARLARDPSPMRRLRDSITLNGAFGRALPFLEVAAPDALRRMLRIAATAKAPVNAIALTVLLKIGDRESGDRLLAWVSSGRANREAEAQLGRPLDEMILDHPIAVHLARSGGPAITAHLEKLARGARSANDALDAIHALGVLHGIPPGLARGLATLDGLELPAADAKALSDVIVTNLLASRPKAALAAYLAKDPIAYLGEWRIDTPAVRAYLGRLRTVRSRRLYGFATAQLAAMGDAAARRESLDVMKAGRYRWVDEVFEDADMATLGYDFKRTIPFWIEELETNCCRRVIATNVFEDAFGLTPEAAGETAEIPADRVRRWWRRHENGKFGQSRISGLFVPYR